MALASFGDKSLSQKHGSLMYLLAQSEQRDMSHFDGILGEDVIAAFGSFEGAMCHEFLHCSRFESDAKDLMKKKLKDYPDYIIWSMAEMPEWLRR